MNSYMFRALYVHNQGEHISLNNHLTFMLSPLCSRTVVISSKYDLYWMELCIKNYKIFNYKILIRFICIVKSVYTVS